MASLGRAYWKGYLRLSLVTIPVEIFNAVDPAGEIKLNQIHKPTGKRINYTKTVKGYGEVEAADIVKGYEVDEDKYVFLEPDELETIKLESKKTCDLTQFVDAKDIDPRYFEKPYYIVPQDEHAAEGYMVIHEALQKMNKVGVGQVTINGREHLVAVSPMERGLVMDLLRYPQELKAPQKYFADLPTTKVNGEMVSLASEIITRLSVPFSPQQFTDRYAQALQELIAQKSKGKNIVAIASGARPKGENVTDFMEALRRSVKGDKPAGPKSAPTAKKRKAS